jgi:UDP-N-acetylmuramyl tripeptide synthase
MAAIAVCEYKSLNKDEVIKSLKKYKPLARRFIKLRENPIIIDDFAHNPSGIKLTIENGAKLGNHLYVIDAIRGSRGESINKEIAEALADVLETQEDYTLILTTSEDVVNNLNTVTDLELEVFTNVLKNRGVSYEIYNSLKESLLETFSISNIDDVILLLGAQGMDPARKILEDNEII